MSWHSWWRARGLIFHLLSSRSLGNFPINKHLPILPASRNASLFSSAYGKSFSLLSLVGAQIFLFSVLETSANMSLFNFLSMWKAKRSGRNRFQFGGDEAGWLKISSEHLPLPTKRKRGWAQPEQCFDLDQPGMNSAGIWVALVQPGVIVHEVSFAQMRHEFLLFIYLFFLCKLS